MKKIIFGIIVLLIAGIAYTLLSSPKPKLDEPKQEQRQGIEMTIITLTPSPIVSFLTCDTDRDCALGAVCRTTEICKPCVTDKQGMPIPCECTRVKKCEPK